MLSSLQLLSSRIINEKCATDIVIKNVYYYQGCIIILYSYTVNT